MMGPCRGTYAVYQFPFGESKLSAFNDQFGWWDWYNRVIKVTFSNSPLRKRTLPPAFPWNSAVLWSLHNRDSFEDLPTCSGIYHRHGLWWKANRNSQEWGMVGNCSWFASNITAVASSSTTCSTTLLRIQGAQLGFYSWLSPFPLTETDSWG